MQPDHDRPLGAVAETRCPQVGGQAVFTDGRPLWTPVARKSRPAADLPQRRHSCFGRDRPAGQMPQVRLYRIIQAFSLIRLLTELLGLPWRLKIRSRTHIVSSVAQLDHARVVKTCGKRRNKNAQSGVSFVGKYVWRRRVGPFRVNGRGPSANSTIETCPIPD